MWSGVILSVLAALAFALSSVISAFPLRRLFFVVRLCEWVALRNMFESLILFTFHSKLILYAPNKHRKGHNYVLFIILKNSSAIRFSFNYMLSAGTLICSSSFHCIADQMLVWLNCCTIRIEQSSGFDSWSIQLCGPNYHVNRFHFSIYPFLFVDKVHWVFVSIVTDHQNGHNFQLLTRDASEMLRNIVRELTVTLGRNFECKTIWSLLHSMVIGNTS